MQPIPLADTRIPILIALIALLASLPVVRAPSLSDIPRLVAAGTIGHLLAAVHALTQGGRCVLGRHALSGARIIASREPFCLSYQPKHRCARRTDDGSVTCDW